jgi:putative addiction module component (TIGR02574 family)
MDLKTILAEALGLHPAERLQLIEMLSKSLSTTNEKIEQIWDEEAEKRLNALKSGSVKTISLEDIIYKYK